MVIDAARHIINAFSLGISSLIKDYMQSDPLIVIEHLTYTPVFFRIRSSNLRMAFYLYDAPVTRNENGFSLHAKTNHSS